MNAADPTAAQATRRLRKWATVSALLLVPATILAGILALTGERAGRCLTYGGCDSNPGWLYQGSLLVAGIAWVTVLCVPRKTVGGTAYVVQLAAQGTFLMAVVTTYP
ncbi:hypothetical protein ACFT9I_16300 [Streptomyces sp. NPDC057137]|uniref:hypothetical protein n=1 Tax=Streptomyces sp. NPDC057137 TaxID=3346030 RepID=UPI00363B60BB